MATPHIMTCLFVDSLAEEDQGPLMLLKLTAANHMKTKSTGVCPDLQSRDTDKQGPGQDDGADENKDGNNEERGWKVDTFFKKSVNCSDYIYDLPFPLLLFGKTPYVRALDASYFITRCDAIYSLMLLAAVEIIRWWLQKEKAKVDFLVTNHILAHAHAGIHAHTRACTHT